MRSCTVFVSGVAAGIAASVVSGRILPFPVPDRGHSCFAVNDESVAVLLSCYLKGRGLGELFTFDPGPTRQMLQRDRRTVWIWYEQRFREFGLPPNARSVVTNDPIGHARALEAALNADGHEVTVYEDLIPELGDKFVVVTCDAFDGWCLIYRRHAVKMGRPPNKRRVIN